MTTTSQSDAEQTQALLPADPPSDGGTDSSDGRSPRSPREGSDRLLPPAPIPRRMAAAGVVGMTLAALLVVLGPLALFDGIVLSGWVDGGEPVLTPLLVGPAEVGAHGLTVAVGVLIALLGLWLLWTGVRPSGRSGVSLGGGTGVWMTNSDLERIVRGTAEDCDGVLSARAQVTRRRVTVRARTTTPDVEAKIRDTISDRLAGLSPAPQVLVHTEPTFADRDGSPR